MKWEPLIRRTFDVQGTSGSEFVCKCLWHDDGKKPSLYVNGVKGVYCCHACGKKGHLRNIARAIPATSTDDIRNRLKLLDDRQSNQRRVYSEGWLAQFDHHHRYWGRRGFSDECIKRFQLGYDPIKRVVTIPVRDPRGQLLGVITRVIEAKVNGPRYRYPKGFPIGNHLFASWMIKNQRKVALVEGTLDAIACWDARVPALALYGSRITSHQVKLLVRLGIEQVVIFTDNDKAGIEAVDQIADALKGTGILTRRVQYRTYWSAKDPGELQPDQIRKAFHSAKITQSVQK